jgi:hypothetical protein
MSASVAANDIWKLGCATASGAKVALAGYQRRGDRADVAREHRADARVDRVAHTLDESVGAHAQARSGRRRHHLDRAMHETRGAKALEIEIAGEVVASGPQRLQRWIELRLDLDERAGRRRHAAADGEPHALGLVDDAIAVDPFDAQHETVGLLALLAQLDKAGE